MIETVLFQDQFFNQIIDCIYELSSFPDMAYDGSIPSTSINSEQEYTILSLDDHKIVLENQKIAARKQSSTCQMAKEKILSLINTEDLDEAWVWLSRFLNQTSGSIEYKDDDNDTLLHIVIQHRDYAKIYALVEYAAKNDPQMLNAANRKHETPLSVAIKQNFTEIVDYLLESGSYAHV